MWLSEKQIQENKDALIKELQKPFYIFVHSALTDYDVEDLRTAPDDEYKAMCKESGRIYSLEDFEKTFNEGDAVSPYIDYIRILKD